MNSLNILSSRVIGPSIISRPRSKSQGDILNAGKREDHLKGSSSQPDLAQFEKTSETLQVDNIKKEEDDNEICAPSDVDENTALLSSNNAPDAAVYKSRLRSLVKRIADALTALLTTIGAPAVYVASCFQDENGNYSPKTPLKRIKRALTRRKARSTTASTVGLSSASQGDSWNSEKRATKQRAQDKELKHSYSSESLKSTTSESEVERKKPKHGTAEGQRSKTKAEPVVDQSGPTRRSIRIKVHSEDFKRRKDRKAAKSDAVTEMSPTPLTVDNIKSPISTSQSHKATRYPHAPQPPRPLIPRRQPSYSNIIPRSPLSRPQPNYQPQKTLVIDLDETLIHSLAKGGRMSSGHMVEVKLNAPVLAPVSSTDNRPTAIIGPQHPILYYVHKRPHCDEFLRKVCKWYKLVVFTASVQEYADPVIDWLEQERKFFVGRYYRQHCTYRNGAYIKDLSSVEPDLSRVCILDNSPMSYIFHEGEIRVTFQFDAELTSMVQTMLYRSKDGSVIQRTMICYI